MENGKLLSSERIESLLACLGEKLAARGKIAEFAIFGGSAIALMFDFRESTFDIDYMPVSGDMTALAQAVAELSTEQALPDGWFNDAIEIFASDKAELRLHGEYPAAQPGIRVFTATPHYLLAMKIFSMRGSLSSHDVKDIWHLVDEIGVPSPEAAIAIAQQFYPDKVLPDRHRLILMDLFESKENGDAYSPMLGW